MRQGEDLMYVRKMKKKGGSEKDEDEKRIGARDDLGCARPKIKE